MIYPKTISGSQVIGIPAPSAGVGKDIPAFEKSLQQLHINGFSTIETESVRNNAAPSNTAKVRAKEWMELWDNPKVGYILSASGGDFLEEMLPYLDWDRMKQNPKWVQGYSDNTGILFPLTTRLDIATVYGPNAGGYDMSILHSSLEKSMDYIRGHFPDQPSYERYQSGWGDGVDGYDLDSEVKYGTPNGDVVAEGRVLGGCLDVLSMLIGTPYEDVKGFIERYREDGVVWYFDIFAMKSEDVAHSLWQMKQAGWFETAKAVIAGRVRFPETMMDMSYEDAFLRVFNKEMPLIMEADVGHVKPQWIMVNGAMCEIRVKDGKGILRQWRK